MSKDVTLVARTVISYRGKSYADNMQFMASPDDAERLIKGKQAEEAPKKNVASKPLEVDFGKPGAAPVLK